MTTLERDKNTNVPEAASLIARMKRAGLSYREAARQLDYHWTYLWEVLHGKRMNPGYRVRKRLDALLTDLEAGK